jgi:hypothetical protein
VGQQPVFRVVRSQGKQVFVFEIGHRRSFGNTVLNAAAAQADLARGFAQRKTCLDVACVTLKV